MTETEWKLLEDLYDSLDKVVKTFHISYDYEEDEYYADFEVDRDCISSIDLAHSDLGYFLGRR